MKAIEFTKIAKNTLSYLSPKIQKEAKNLLTTVAVDDLYLDNNSYKLSIPQKNCYSLKLTEQFRIIVENFDDHIEILDILNYQVYKNYFNTVKSHA